MDKMEKYTNVLKNNIKSFIKKNFKENICIDDIDDIAELMTGASIFVLAAYISGTTNVKNKRK